MSAAEITVVARWHLKDGALGEVLSILAELRPASLAEPGCLSYEVYQGVGAAGSLLLLERYSDQAAIDAHKQSAHYQALVVERVLPLLAERQVELLRAV